MAAPNLPEFQRAPGWWRGAVAYQIYPRSFEDSDGDGIGDLPGVLARLDHLEDGTERSLGVDAIWLSPFYPSPLADFGYDVADYTDVDPAFGTLADFDRLLEACHARGVKVIVDWVPNHSSDHHPWFEASRSSRDDPKRGWYVWRDGAPGGGPPDASRSTFTRAGAAWTHDQRTGQWYRHEFTAGQPDLNWADPDLAEAMLDTLRFWLDRGVDGFRIDVAHRLDHDVLRRVRAVLEEYDDRMAVGEVYLLDQRELVRFLVTGDGLHLAHNFVFLRTPWRAARFREVIEEFETLAAPLAWPSWCLENHDHSRVATRYDEGGHGPARARAAGLMLLTLRGTAFLYQGQELGLPDARIPPDAAVDIGGRDPERAPIPWEPPSVAGPGAGFTTGTPWLPVVEDAERLAAAAQDRDPRSTLSLFRRLIRLRRATPALRDGDQTMLDAAPHVLAWVREADGER
ncbi:MAG TPA: alpha-amylase family glycosyl hydrolase, partial [Solirubrobacteraceae bacterium]|nr:alpha-amylase family glycosyl hydrolase [Solirubrobacteraceae bacterium]